MPAVSATQSMNANVKKQKMYTKTYMKDTSGEGLIGLKKEPEH